MPDVEGIAAVTINDLNEYALRIVFGHLPPTDRVRIERVSKRWREVAKDSWNETRTLKLAKDCTLEVEGTRIASRRGITSVASRCRKHVRRLELRAYDEGSRNLAAILASFCRGLRSVSLYGVSRCVLTILAKKCRDLREFRLRDASQTCDDELSRLFRFNRRLATVELTAVRSNRQGDYLRDLPLDGLECLGAFLCGISADNFVWVLQRATQLTKLEIDECRLDDKCLRTVSTSSVNLRELQLGVFLPMVKKLQHIRHLNNLRRIDVSSCASVTDEFLHSLSRCCLNLTDVNVADCTKLSDEGVRQLAVLPKLERLNLSMLNVTDAAYESMPVLKELDCFGCTRLTNEYFANVVATCERLELLNVSSCGKVNNAFVNAATNEKLARAESNADCVVLAVYVGQTRVRFRKIKRASPHLRVIFATKLDVTRRYMYAVEN